MELTNSKLLFCSLIIGLALAVASGVPVRWIWSSPGGSAYGIGFPIVYQFQYCGGYAPCYWAQFYKIGFLEDVLLWFIISSAILAIARKLKHRKRRFASKRGKR
jgi:hypothetical protein